MKLQGPQLGILSLLIIFFTFFVFTLPWRNADLDKIEQASTALPMEPRLYTNIKNLHPNLHGVRELMNNPNWVNQFGRCQATSQLEFDARRANHYKLISEKIQKNSTKINTELFINDKIAQHLIYLIQLLPLVDEIDTLEKNPLVAKLFADPVFRNMLSEPDFLAKVKSQEFLDHINQSEFVKVGNTAELYSAIGDIQKKLRKPHDLEAIEYLRRQGLSLIQKIERDGAKALVDSFKGHYRKMHKLPPQSDIKASQLIFVLKENLSIFLISKSKRKARKILLVDFPYPQNIAGTWAEKLRAYIEESFEDFLLNNPTGNEKLDNIAQNQEVNFFDVIFRPFHETPQQNQEKFVYRKLRQDGGYDTIEVSAFKRAEIDFLARTIWGEASICTDQNQIEVVARVLADRGEAIEKTFSNIEIAESANSNNTDKVYQELIKKNPIFGKLVQPITTGFQLYGRTDLLQNYSYDEIKNWGGAVQAASRAFQFSVWNYQKLAPMSLGNLVDKSVVLPSWAKNFMLNIGIPQGTGGGAFRNALCPEIPINREYYKQYPAAYLQGFSARWQHMVAAATLLALDIEKVKTVYQWPGKIAAVYNYCHQGVLQPGNRVHLSPFTVLSDLDKPLVADPGSEGFCRIDFFFSP